GARIIKNALNEIEISIKDKILKIREEIEGKMRILERYGAQTAPVTMELRQITAAVDQRDYIEAKEHVNLAKKSLSQIAEIKSRESLGNLKKYVDDLRKSGISVPDRCGELEVLITGGQYLDAILKYDEIMNDLNQKYAAQIMGIVEETEGYISSTGHLITAPANFLETLKQVRKLVENKDYNSGYQIACQVRQHVISQIEGKINGIISEAQGYIEKFKNIGAEILSAAIVINNASLLLSQKKYPEAYALANEAISKIMTAVREHTAREIEDYKSFISDCERTGIDVTKFREGVVRAEKLLMENRIMETYSAIKETKKLGDESMATYLASRVNDTIAKIDEAERMGVDTSRVLEMRNRVSSVQKSPNVLDALRELKNVEQEASELTEENVKKVYASIKEIQEFFTLEGISLTETENLLRAAEMNLRAKNYVEAMAALIEAETITTEKVEHYISDEITKWKKYISILSRISESPNLQEQLRKVHDLLIVKEYKKAHLMLKELDTFMKKTVEEKLIPMAENRLKEIGEIKKMGIDLTRIEVKLMETLQKLKTPEYLQALEVLDEITREYNSMLISQTKNELEIFSKNIELAQILGFRETDKYRETVTAATNLINAGKYFEALKKIHKDQIEIYSRLSESINKNIEKCIEEMELVSELHIDFSEVNAMIESAKMKMKYMDIMSAYTLVTNAKNLIPEIIKGQITREIENLMEKARWLKESGIDVSAHVHFLEKARERLNAGRHSEAKFLIVRYMNSILPVLEENFDKSVELLKATINTAKIIGVKVEGESTLWADIKKHVATGDYIGVNDIIDAYQKNLINRIEETVREELQKFSALLEVATVYRCGVENIADAFAKAQNNFKNRRYVEALNLSKQNIEKLSKILEEKAQIELKNIKTEMEEYARYGVEIDIPKKILEEAEKRLHEKNYSLAFESIVRCRKTMEQNVTQFEKNLIETTQSLLADAQEMKINVDEGRTIFINGRELFNAGKLVDAAGTLVTAKDKIAQQLKSELRTRIETMNSTLEIGREMKIDLSEIEQHLQHALKNLLINNFMEAHKFIAMATSKFVTLATATLGQEISKLEALISIGESVGCNLIQNRKEILKTKEMVVNKEFISAKHSLDELTAKTKQTISLKVVEELKGTRAILELARKLGLDVSKQDDIIRDAEELEKKEKYQEAYNYAIETKAYLVNSIVKFINSEISNVSAMLNIALSIGVPELAPAREEIDRSLKKLHEMEFENAHAMVESAKKHIVANSTEYLGALLKDAENILSDARNIEANVGEELYTEVENARNLINQQRFREAKELIMKIYDMGLELAQGKMQEKMNILNSLLELAKNFRIPVENASETMNSILENINAKNFRNANRRCLEFTKKVSELLQNYCESQIMHTAKLIDLGESMGIKLIEIKRNVESTWALLRNKQYREVVVLTTDAQRKIESMIDVFIKEQIQQTQNDVKYAESIGANTVKVREIVASATTKYSEKDYLAAYRILREAENVLSKTLQRHILDSVSVARLTYDIGIRAGVDLSGIEEKLREIEQLINEKKFRDAYFKVVETRKAIISQIEEYMNGVMNGVNQKIETANELGVDTTNARAMFEVAKNTLRGKDYLEAKRVLIKIEETIDAQCRDYLLDEYSNLMRKTEEFRGKDVDTSEVLATLEKVKGRIDNKLYVEAKLLLETVRAKIRNIERIVKLGV
ncbi:MAG: hypothetical protein ACP5JR_01280, partial [Thermoplasmata archaeon]